MFDLPKISCVMITSSPNVENSIHCFQNQLYPNKELIVFSELDLSQLRSGNIHYVPCNNDLTLGEKRDIAIELSSGQLICQWDGDDLYGPYRLYRQSKPLIASHRTDASFCSEFLKYNKNTGKVYWLDFENGIEDYTYLLEDNPHFRFLSGSIMFKKSLYYENGYTLYPKINSGEDVSLAKRLARRSASVRGLNYVYVYHGLNVLGEEYHCKTIFSKKKIVPEKEVLESKEEILRLFDFCKMSGVEMCTSSLVNFEFHKDAVLDDSVVFKSRL